MWYNGGLLKIGKSLDFMKSLNSAMYGIETLVPTVTNHGNLSKDTDFISFALVLIGKFKI